MNLIISSLSQGVGVFLGIIIGIIVTIVSQRYVDKGKEQETLGYLKFEIDLNIGKIERWLEEINNYRNAVNSDTIDKYFGYFDLSRFVTTFFYNTFYSGLLYKYLDFDNVNKLQIIFSEFSQNWENFINTDITSFRKTFIDDGKDYDKADLVQRVNFWENKFKEHRKTLRDIKKLLEKK